MAEEGGTLSQDAIEKAVSGEDDGEAEEEEAIEDVDEEAAVDA